VVTTQPSKLVNWYGTLKRTVVVFPWTRNDPQGANALPFFVSQSS